MSFGTGFAFGMFIQAAIVAVFLYYRPEAINVAAGIENCVIFLCLTIFFAFLDSKSG